jgi:hypothetical protein
VGIDRVFQEVRRQLLGRLRITGRIPDQHVRKLRACGQVAQKRRVRAIDVELDLSQVHGAFYPLCECRLH